MGAASSIEYEKELFSTLKIIVDSNDIVTNNSLAVDSESCDAGDDKSDYAQSEEDIVYPQEESKVVGSLNTEVVMGEANPLSLTIENKGHILSPKEHELYQRVVGSIIHWNRKVELRNNAIFCQLVDVDDAVESAFQTGLTPLIVDQSPDDKVSTYYSYQPNMVILESKTMIMDHFVKNNSVLQCLEYARRRLVTAMKYGKTLVVRMSTSSPDFQTIFRDECVPGLDNSEKMSAFFPLDAIIEGGKRLHEDGWADRLFREDDMKPHKNFCLCRSEFRVCFTTQFALDDIDEFLFKHSLPGKERFKVVCIDYGEETET